jgi:hypothetical protein
MVISVSASSASHFTFQLNQLCSIELKNPALHKRDFMDKSGILRTLIAPQREHVFRLPHL